MMVFECTYTRRPSRQPQVCAGLQAEQHATWQVAPEVVLAPTPLPAIAALGTSARRWHLSSVRGSYGVSGAYDIAAIVDALAKRGLNRYTPPPD